MKQTDQTKTALYCRTAQSSYAGIKRQMDSLKTYAEQQGFANVEFFIDDGIGGLNYDRPEFQHIVREIEAGNVKTVIAIDLTRYGRDFIENMRVLGELHDRYGVRFLTLFDGEFPGKISVEIQAAIDACISEMGGATK